MFRLFRTKNKSCLKGKTEQQKIEFFTSLAKFSSSDKQFFEEQYWNLLPHERKEFSDWVVNDTGLKMQILDMIQVIKKLADLKM